MDDSTEEQIISCGSKIVVVVQQALPDIIVVTYQKGKQLFQGVLLDTKNGQLPCGIYPTNNQYPPPNDLSNEKLYSVKQRHSYFCQDTDAKKGASADLSKSIRSKGARPSVRLRPRQVLCSACQSVCNEKKESVGGSGIKVNSSQKTSQEKFSKSSQTVARSTVLKPIRETRHSTNSSVRETRQSVAAQSKEQSVALTRPKRKASDVDTSTPSLVPRLKKLKQNDINKLNCNKSPSNKKTAATKSVISSNKSTNKTQQDKIPKLKLSTSVTNSSAKKVPKVTISTVSKEPRSSEGTTIRTRSNVNNNSDDAVFMELETNSHASPVPPADAGKPEKLEVKVERDLRSRTVQIHTSEPDTCDTIETDKASSSNVPKLTILPFGQKLDTPAKSNDEEDKNEVSDDSSKLHAAPLLKIYIGPDGNGRIMNISPKITEEKTKDEEASRRANVSVTAKAAKRALKRARREAHKKTMLGGASPSYSLMGGMSPRFGGMSPRRFSGGMSPACHHNVSGASPARLASPGRIGGASPARFYGFGSVSPARAAFDQRDISVLSDRKHKHKVKHKKKHKSEKKLKENCERKKLGEISPNCSTDSKESSNSGDVFTEKKGSDVLESTTGSSSEPSSRTSSPNTPHRQKLSLSIKRVSNDKNEYIACDITSDIVKPSSDARPPVHSNLPSSDLPKYPSEHRLLITTKKTSFSRDGSSSPSEDQFEIPDFPSEVVNTNKIQDDLSLKFRWRDVDQCTVNSSVSSNKISHIEDNTDSSSTGIQKSSIHQRSFSVGDVVWGKIRGFPWWPGKIISLRILEDLVHNSPLPSHSYAKGHEAHISWFKSSTTSRLDAACLQPFLEFYNLRYIKKKRGPYKAAVREALAQAETLKKGLEGNDDDSSLRTIVEDNAESKKSISTPCIPEEGDSAKNQEPSVCSSVLTVASKDIHPSSCSSSLLVHDNSETSSLEKSLGYPGSNICEQGTETNLSSDETSISILSGISLKQYPMFKTSKIDTVDSSIVPSLLNDLSSLPDSTENNFSVDSSEVYQGGLNVNTANVISANVFSITESKASLSGCGLTGESSTSNLPQSSSTCYSGQSPEVDTSPGVPRLGSPAPPLLESLDYLSQESSSVTAEEGNHFPIDDAPAFDGDCPSSDHSQNKEGAGSLTPNSLVERSPCEVDVFS